MIDASNYVETMCLGEIIFVRIPLEIFFSLDTIFHHLLKSENIK